MSSPFTQTQLKTPKGFEHLLEGLCKEVLRRQPENILEYATEHFSRLMKLREETGYDGYTPKAEIELESQETNEREVAQEIPILLEPEEPKAEEPQTEEPKVEEPQTEEPKAEEPQTEEPQTEEPKAEEPKREEQGAVGEIQDDAPEAEQAVTIPVETKTAEEITPEFEKTDLTSSLPEAEAPVDDTSPEDEVTGNAEEGDIISSNVAQDTEPTVEAQGAAESEAIKDPAPEDSAELPVDPASAELPVSDGDSDS